MVVRGPDCVLDPEPLGVPCDFLHRGPGPDGILYRRMYVHVHPEPLAEDPVKNDGRARATRDREAESLTFPCPDKHVSDARVKGRNPLGVSGIARDRVELCVVVDFEFDLRARDRPAARVLDHDRRPARRDIPVDHVDFGEARRAPDDVLGAMVVAIHVRMQDHRARNGGVEPGHVQPRFGFACAHEPPPSVCPNLDPGVVVIGVGPSRSVDLPCRNARRPQRRNRQHGLLSTPPVAIAHGHRGG